MATQFPKSNFSQKWFYFFIDSGLIFCIINYMSIRKAAVAGFFYPDKKNELEQVLRTLLGQAKEADTEYETKALIVPHAGYSYSGPVAASAYRQIRKKAGQVKKVVLLGPSHRVAIQGLALSSADGFETPFGDLEVDQALNDMASSIAGVSINDKAHQNEHSLEVQLPFLQLIFSAGIKILPVVCNQASPFQIAKFIEKVWGDGETLLLISSDLSHYLPYREAIERDKKTADAICQYDFEKLDEDGACGYAAISGFLHFAKGLGLKPKLLDLRNSGDISLEKDRVVGYGAFCFI